MTVRYGRVAGSVLAVLLLAGCGGRAPTASVLPNGEPDPQIAEQWQTRACRTPRPPETNESTGARMRNTPPDLDNAITRISQDGPKLFAAWYSGIEFVPDQAQAIVYRVPSSDFDDFVREVAGDSCIVVRDAFYSRAELIQLTDRISADMGYWRERGIRINVVGPKNDGSGVRVGTQDVAAARTKLPERYGDQPPLFIEENGPVAPV